MIWIGISEPQALAREPLRVVSANLCADQLILSLADPTQIISLGPFARDPALSFMHREAQRYPSNRGSAEEMIGLKADIVFLGNFDSRYTRAILDRQKISYVTVEPWTNMASGRQQIREVAQSLGQQQRGNELIAQIDRRIAALEDNRTNMRTGINTLVLHRRGYVMHAGIIVELAQLAGFVDAASRMGLAASGFVPLEQLVAGATDYLIVARDVAAPGDQGETLLVHPGLLRLYPRHKRLAIPDRLTICAGPSTPALVDWLLQEIADKIR